MPLIAHAMPCCAATKQPQTFSSCSNASRLWQLSTTQYATNTRRRQLVQQLSARHNSVVKYGWHHPSCSAQQHHLGWQHQPYNFSPNTFMHGAVHSAISSRQRRHTVAAASFMDLMGQIAKDLASAQVTGSSLTVDKICYHPAGSPTPLLTDISLQLPANQLGLIFGRSGAGKTTLLQMLAGLTHSTSGTICLGSGPEGASSASGAAALTPPELAKCCGLVFQFPERYFLGDTIAQELAFGWPVDYTARQALGLQAEQVLQAVGLKQFPVNTPLQQLSGGYKRRVALAVQLTRRPKVLLLDEPLAGLDWKARMEVADVLRDLKKTCTVLVVSHDLRELTPLVDKAWEMQPGGILNAASWPPARTAS